LLNVRTKSPADEETSYEPKNSLPRTNTLSGIWMAFKLFETIKSIGKLFNPDKDNSLLLLKMKSFSFNF